MSNFDIEIIKEKIENIHHEEINKINEIEGFLYLLKNEKLKEEDYINDKTIKINEINHHLFVLNYLYNKKCKLSKALDNIIQNLDIEHIIKNQNFLNNIL